MEINSWVKEIIAGSIFLIVIFYVFRNGGKDFTAIIGGIGQSYTQSVKTLQGR